MIQLRTTQKEIKVNIYGSDETILEELAFSVMRILSALEESGGTPEPDSLPRLILSLIALHERQNS